LSKYFPINLCYNKYHLVARQCSKTPKYPAPSHRMMQWGRTRPQDDQIDIWDQGTILSSVPYVGSALLLYVAHWAKMGSFYWDSVSCKKLSLQILVEHQGIVTQLCCILLLLPSHLSS
jgi:hypothetical protein